MGWLSQCHFQFWLHRQTYRILRWFGIRLHGECYRAEGDQYWLFQIARYSTCVTRTAGGFPTCAPMRPASTRSFESATGIITLTAPPLPTGKLRCFFWNDKLVGTCLDPRAGSCDIVACKIARSRQRFPAILSIYIILLCVLLFLVKQFCARYYLNDLTYRTDPPKSSTEQYNVRRRKSKGSYREEADLEADQAEAEADIDLYNFIVPYWSLLSGENDRVHRAYQP